MSAHCMITSVLVPSTLHNDALWSQFMAYLFIWYIFWCTINVKIASSYNLDIIVLVVWNGCLTDFSSKQRLEICNFLDICLDHIKYFGFGTCKWIKNSLSLLSCLINVCGNKYSSLLLMRDALFHAKVRQCPEELGPSGTGNKIEKRTLINANYHIFSYQTKKKKKILYYH